MNEVTHDRWGVPVASASAPAIAEFDQAVEDLVALAGEPLAHAEAAVVEDPHLVLGHLFIAYLHLYATTQEARTAARAILDDLARGVEQMPQRERYHYLAARAWLDGELELAASAWESALRHAPRDLLALKVAQDAYFFLGDQRALRDSPARVLSSWPEGTPGWGYVRAMLAFGFEENGTYDRAEELALSALAENAADIWAVHAQAHVFEMRGDPRKGAEFLSSTLPDWGSSYFANHNWWHKALFHIDLGELDEALATYEEHVHLDDPQVWLDVVDAASLLWRLDLFGVDCARRAEPLAQWFSTKIEEVIYAFNDWHMAMVFSLANRDDLLDALIAANRSRAVGSNRRVVDSVGLAVMETFARFGRAEHDLAAHELLALRPRAFALGGSHAQRDVLDLTLLAAAAAAGNDQLVRAISTERVTLRPSTARATSALVKVASGRGARTARH